MIKKILCLILLTSAFALAPAKSTRQIDYDNLSRADIIEQGLGDWFLIFHCNECKTRFIGHRGICPKCGNMIDVDVEAIK